VRFLSVEPHGLEILPSTRADQAMSLIPSAPFLIIPKFTEPEKTFLCMDLSRWTRTQDQ